MSMNIFVDSRPPLYAMGVKAFFLAVPTGSCMQKGGKEGWETRLYLKYLYLL